MEYTTTRKNKRTFYISRDRYRVAQSNISEDLYIITNIRTGKYHTLHTDMKILSKLYPK